MGVNLSDGEWRLMDVLWQEAPCTITKLVEHFRESTGWSKHTVITMLSRLEAKGAVRHEEGERAKQFYPVIEAADAKRQETQSFLSKLYQGSLGLMVNTMVREKALSREEIEELYAILKQAEEGEK